MVDHAVRACVVMLAVVLGLAWGVFSGPAAAQESVQIAAIQVEGNRRIEAETIRVTSGLQPGQPATAADLDAAFQNLFQTGLFDDVTVTARGTTVVIEVVENPTINQIAIEGNKSIDDEVLQNALSLRPRLAFTRAAAEADARAIQQAYAAQGRFNTAVEPRIIRLEENRVNLVFEVREGRVNEVQRIAFVGNEAYSDRRLRRVVETGQAGILSALFTNDTYDAARLEADQARLREFYRDRGYIDFEVLSAAADFARERDAFFLTFRVSEGQQFEVGQSRVESFAPDLDTAAFEALIDLRPGTTFSQSRLDRVVERMAFEAGQQGFAFVEVTPRLIPDRAAGRVDIVFELVQGPRVFIERIDIRGNTETVDRVIRRQFRVVEGDPFNARELREAEQRIRALGFFETVETRVREGSGPNRAVIVVDVVEAPTGSLSFGAAYGSAEGLTGTVSLTERNFLGRGQRVSLELSEGAETSTYAFSFSEPAVFDQDLSAGLDLFYRRFDYDESSINTTRIGAEPSIGFPLSRDSRLRIRLPLASEEIRVRAGGASPILEREAGEEFVGGIGFTYTLDLRNSPIEPTGGFLLRLDQEFIGLDPDTQYSKTRARATAFTSLFREDVVLSAEVEGGTLVSFTDSSRFVDRFVLGGDSFRGFERGGLGPRDSCAACGPSGEAIDDALGGNSFAVARLEATFPIGLPDNLGISGGVFADAGTLWDLYDVDGASGTVDDSARLRSAVGASLFWDTPIGPLRFNYAVPVESVDGDQFERFRLTVDSRF